jgi:type II secretory pathway component GspD/PulD (secretin)
MMKWIRLLSLLALVGGCASARTGIEGSLVRVVPIRNVGADALAAELVEQERLRGSDPVSVTVDPRTNALVLACSPGHPDALTALLKRVAELDETSRSKWTGHGGSNCHGRQLFTQVVFLRHVPATELTQGFEGFRKGMHVVADGRTNSLEVYAESAADLSECLVEIGRQDQEQLPTPLPGVPTAMQVVPLKHASATELAAALSELLEASRRAVEGRGCPGFFVRSKGEHPRDAGGPTSVEADLRTNSLIVVAKSATDLERMLELIGRLDRDEPPQH